MRIAVLNNCAPFARGGAELLAEELVAELRARDHDAILVKVPLRWQTPDDVVDSACTALLMRIEGADRVVGLKFPAYLAPHENAVIWLVHQFRQVYDLWGSPYGELLESPEAWRLRAIVRRLDDDCFSRCRRVYTVSQTVSDRLLRYNGVPSQVLHPPLRRQETVPRREPGDYLLALGRIGPGKRQTLAVDAMRETRTEVRLVIAGQPDDEAALAALEQAIERSGAADRITLHARFVPDGEKASLVEGSRAVVYLPFEEDSIGYVTAEAAAAGRAVITADDAGGVITFVQDGVSGVVAEPSPAALAQAFDRLQSDAGLASTLGLGAFAMLEPYRTTWDDVVEALTR